MSAEPQLEVMIATLGDEALQKMTAERLEPTPGVRYLVSVQMPNGSRPIIPAFLKSRDDVRIMSISGKGVARNRNNLLRVATAPYLLLADDDVVYKSANLEKIIAAFQKNPDVDVAIFKIKCAEPRPYPEAECTLKYGKFRKNFYPYVCETAIRRSSFERLGITFDERYGINAGYLHGGEEDVFIYDAWRKGLNIKFFPIEILEHDAASTVTSRARHRGTIRASGAVLRHIYGRWAYPRIVLKALRSPGNFVTQLKLLTDGARYEKKTSPK